MISLENVVFQYPSSSNPTLDIETFSLNSGESVFLKGPSGSGKTTLLGLITGILLPLKGSVTINNQNLSLLSTTARDRFRGENIGYIFQQFNLLPYLTVKENLELVLSLNPSRSERALNRFGNQEKAIHHYLTHLKIESLALKKVTELSVGQAQRVAVARALLGQPSLIVADEPTSSLDADARKDFMSLLTDEVKEQNATLLFVSHDSQLATFFDRSIDLTVINKAFRKIL